jgi:hypothetical protein
MNLDSRKVQRRNLPSCLDFASWEGQMVGINIDIQLQESKLFVNLNIDITAATSNMSWRGGSWGR